jgi:hypothetical protein
MHYLEIGLLSLPVIWGLAYCIRDLRRGQNWSASKPDAQTDSQNKQPATQGNWADGISEGGSVDIGTLDPQVKHAVSETAHAAAVDLGQAIEQIGHWIHH